MALSNIFNEPRREITETVVGVVVVALILLPAVLIALALIAFNPGMPWYIAGLFGLVFYLLGVMVGWGLLQFVHATGELACEVLEDRGLRLRPKRRP